MPNSNLELDKGQRSSAKSRMADVTCEWQAADGAGGDTRGRPKARRDGGLAAVEHPSSSSSADQTIDIAIAVVGANFPEIPMPSGPVWHIADSSTTTHGRYAFSRGSRGTDSERSSKIVVAFFPPSMMRTATPAASFACVRDTPSSLLALCAVEHSHLHHSPSKRVAMTTSCRAASTPCACSP